MNELKAAIGAVGRRGEKAERQLDAGRRQRIGDLLQPLDMELKILMKRPLIAGWPDHCEAAVGPQSSADFQEQPYLRKIGLEVLIVARPANWQSKPANPDLGTAQIAAGLSHIAGLGPAKDLADLDLQSFETVRKSDFHQLALSCENPNGGRT